MISYSTFPYFTQPAKVVLKPRKPISLNLECGKNMGENIRIQLRFMYHISKFTTGIETVFKNTYCNYRSIRLQEVCVQLVL